MFCPRNSVETEWFLNAYQSLWTASKNHDAHLMQFVLPCIYTRHKAVKNYLPVLLRDTEALDWWCGLLDKPLSLTLPSTRLSWTSENSPDHEFMGIR